MAAKKEEEEDWERLVSQLAGLPEVDIDAVVRLALESRARAKGGADALRYSNPTEDSDVAVLTAREGDSPAIESPGPPRFAQRPPRDQFARGLEAKQDRKSLAAMFADVEEAIYDHGFAERMRTYRLARTRRDPSWAEQWLSIEDEYDTRCQRALTLLGDGVDDVALHDGHVAELVLTAQALIDRRQELLARAPHVYHVHVIRYADVGTRLFTSPALRGMHSLGLRDQALEDEDIEALVKSPHIEGLRWLDLSYNELSARSFELLANCPALVHLEYLGLDGNAAESPVDQIGTDPIDGAVVHTARTAVGRALEDQLGELKWLHAPARYPYSYPPTPLHVAKRP